mmetsp:Transcript_10443/g.29368  ORF Transcript_10443/g.29368 Transcript_10443/m.29368 type:complete len:334 (+) Transcript_10443:176-1177(+)
MFTAAVVLSLSQVALREALGLLLPVWDSEAPGRTPKDLAARKESQGRQLLEVQGDVEVVPSFSPEMSTSSGEDKGGEDESFRPDNIVLQDLVPCGNTKCFYPLKSNPQVGYLVWDAEYLRRSVDTVLKKCQATLDFAQSLEERYGPINHYLLGNPISLTLSSEHASVMNENCPFTGSRFKPEHGNRTRYHPGHEVVVQKSQRIAGSTIVVKAYRGEKLYNYFQEQINEFLSSVSDPISFARRFTENIIRTRRLLHEEICLGQDFQVLLDSRGEFYHIDLDRCIEKDGSGKRKKSGAKLRAEKSLEDLDQIELAVYRTLFGSAVSAVVAVAEEG